MSDKDEKRQIYSSIKIMINLGLALGVTISLMLIGIFALDKFDVTKDNSAAYWSQKGLTAAATFILMLSTANITEEFRKKKDGALNERVKSLDGHYGTIMENGETEELEKLLTALNRKNKYCAYVKKWKKRHTFLVSHKPKKDKDWYNRLLEKVETKLLATPDEVFEDEFKVRYSEVTYSQMVSGEFDVSSNEDDFDLQVHRGKFALKKLLWKIISIVSFGGIVADFAFSFQNFSKDMILSMILKCVIMLISTYSGICFGYFMVDRIKTVLKRKLRIFSQFRARKENTALIDDEKWIVTIPKDITVDKIREKYSVKVCDGPKFNGSDKVEQVIDKEPKSLKTHYSALNGAYEETFGADKPVRVGAFVGKVLEHTLKNEAQKNVENLQKPLDKQATV